MRQGLYDRTPKATPEWKRRWPNFLPKELCCKCGGQYCNGSYYQDDPSMDALQQLRYDMNAPLFITSGHRCIEWNRIQKGAKNSRHLWIAFDIRLAGHDRFKLRERALAVGFNGIGTAMTFLHVDIRPVPATWDYGPASKAYWTR